MGFSKRAGRARLGTATLVSREWTWEHGVIEHEERFANLTELLEACLDASATVPERITLTGTDGDGREQEVSFSFASSRRRF